MGAGGIFDCDDDDDEDDHHHDHDDDNVTSAYYCANAHPQREFIFKILRVLKFSRFLGVLTGIYLLLFLFSMSVFVYFSLSLFSFCTASSLFSAYYSRIYFPYFFSLFPCMCFFPDVSLFFFLLYCIY